ncbi:hypothetical protein LV779_26565 [Streptomyces thinghirensis]|nr:hypothetical protein [Streptomyces thinghirensis]
MGRGTVFRRARPHRPAHGAPRPPEKKFQAALLGGPPPLGPRGAARRAAARLGCAMLRRPSTRWTCSWPPSRARSAATPPHRAASCAATSPAAAAGGPGRGQRTPLPHAPGVPRRRPRPPPHRTAGAPARLQGAGSIWSRG